MQKLGLFLFVLSFLPWVAIIFLLPLLSLTLSQKAILGTALAVFAETCFWIGVAILGKEVISKYRRYLSPRYLWQNFRNFIRRH